MFEVEWKSLEGAGAKGSVVMLLEGVVVGRALHRGLIKRHADGLHGVVLCLNRIASSTHAETFE
jgi:hypothetical protein